MNIFCRPKNKKLKAQIAKLAKDNRRKIGDQIELLLEQSLKASKTYIGGKDYKSIDWRK